MVFFKEGKNFITLYTLNIDYLAHNSVFFLRRVVITTTELYVFYIKINIEVCY